MPCPRRVIALPVRVIGLRRNGRSEWPESALRPPAALLLDLKQPNDRKLDRVTRQVMALDSAAKRLQSALNICR